MFSPRIFWVKILAPPLYSKVLKIWPLLSNFQIFFWLLCYYCTWDFFKGEESNYFLFESGSYLFRAICVWIHMCKSRLSKKVEQTSEHLISQANPNACEGVEPLKLTFLAQVTYKSKSS
jgi:hypothetical protein